MSYFESVRQSGAPWAVSGSITVANLPAVTAVSGSITAYGNGARITATPAMSGLTYASGQLIGSPMTLAGATRVPNGLAIIESLVLTDKAKAAGAVNIVFFRANPSGSTFTDHSTLTIADADLVKIIGAVPIASTDYVSFNDNAVATKTGLGFEIDTADGSLYAVIQSASSNAYASASDLQLGVAVLYCN